MAEQLPGFPVQGPGFRVAAPALETAEIGGSAGVQRSGRGDRLEIRQNPGAPTAAPEAPKREQVAKPTGENAGGDRTGTKGAAPVRVVKIGRNDPCPCGSGLKWKKCTCAKFHPNGTEKN